MKREQITTAKRIVVKVGSSLVSQAGSGVDSSLIEQWVGDIAHVRKQGRSVILVSSGAVACGLARLAHTQRPTNMVSLQAVAAIGQSALMQAYDRAFSAHNTHCAQVLLTHADLSDRSRYLNARSTVERLLEYGVVPVVNENDTVTIDEFRFGDNDTLAALMANLISADLMVLLSDQEGLLASPPTPDAPVNPEPIDQIAVRDPSLPSIAGEGGPLGTGGMKSKIRAARLAARSATQTIIANGNRPHVLSSILLGKTVGTLLFNQDNPALARKHWIRAQLKVSGTLTIDQGAVKALCHNSKSLLPVGVIDCSGQFNRGDVVLCQDAEHKPIARGMCNYSYREVRRLMGKPSCQIADIIGYDLGPELIHRDNLVLEE